MSLPILLLCSTLDSHISTCSRTALASRRVRSSFLMSLPVLLVCSTLYSPISTFSRSAPQYGATLPDLPTRATRHFANFLRITAIATIVPIATSPTIPHTSTETSVPTSRSCFSQQWLTPANAASAPIACTSWTGRSFGQPESSTLSFRRSRVGMPRRTFCI
jgi:hypothetical protein